MQRNLPEPFVFFGKHERLTAIFDGFDIPIQDSVAGVATRHAQMFGVNGYVRTRREPNQIRRPRQGEGFIEIIDSPNEPSLSISPSSEILRCEDPH